MQKFSIDQENAGARLDVFLTKKYQGEHSRAHITRNISAGQVSVNKTQVKPSYILKIDDVLEWNISPKEPNTLLENKEIVVEKIFEDEHILAINKPAGLQMHPSDTEKKYTLANWIVATHPEISTVGEDSMRPGIVHRLDKDTSGVVVIAKTQESFSALKTLFFNRHIQKTYLALLYGELENSSGSIDFPIARSINFRRQTAITPQTKKYKGIPREALTTYTTLDNFNLFQAKNNISQKCTLVETKPKTGRMHQIRVHFYSIGHPVVGDILYVRKGFPQPQEVKRQLLHAQKLEFSLFGKQYSLKSPLPKDFETYLQNLRKY